MVDFSKIIRLINAGNGPVFSHFNDHGKLCMEILYVKLFQGGRLRVRAKVPWRGPAHGQGCVQVNMLNNYVSIQFLQLPQ